MKVFSEDDDGENKALMQDNPKHGEGTGQTECCGESAIFILFCLFFNLVSSESTFFLLLVFFKGFNSFQ